MAGASIVGTGLTSVDVTHKDGRAWAKTILISCGKIGEAWTNSGATCDFYYQLQGDDKQEPVVKLTTETLTETLLQTAIENADCGNPRFFVHVMSENRGFGEVQIDRMVRIYSEDILYGIDIDTTTMYLYVQRGNNKTVRLKLSHIITDIISVSSTSASLSQS